VSFAKVAESSSFEELFAGMLSGFDIGRAELEHPIEQAGQFVDPTISRFSHHENLPGDSFATRPFLS
jgi:hypothetical protein